MIVAAKEMCYYLQEQGLREEFYRKFRASAGEDPSGSRSVRASEIAAHGSPSTRRRAVNKIGLVAVALA
jgi:hypothetical protein